MFENQVNLFGSKLLEKSHEMLLVANSAEDFAILVELLVKSHDCFIHSCSMDGISNILSESKLCADKLEKAGEFNLMVWIFSFALLLAQKFIIFLLLISKRYAY